MRRRARRTTRLALATFGWGWHIEAGLAVLRLILRGTFDRHPQLQIVLGHWGEMLLFALDRVDGLSNVATHLDRRVSEYFQTNVHIATSGMLTPRLLRHALDFTGADRILLSGNYPAAAIRGRSRPADRCAAKTPCPRRSARESPPRGATVLRIDTHHHLIPPDYRKALRRAGIDDAGGRALPDWSADGSLAAMAELGVGTAILSVSTPGTGFLPAAADAAALARDLNDYAADLVAGQPDRFGFFATVPMPHIEDSVAETVRALDELAADGVVLLANNAGVYLGQDGQAPLFEALDERSATVFIHPADLPGPAVPGIAPFAVDFLLDTTRAAYLLVRNGIRRRYPNIRFILSHAGGFVPYASHRMAVAIMGDTGRSPADSLDDFAGFYFDTALSSSAAALPALLAFAEPGHITFGSDWPFAPVAAGKFFAAGLETYSGLDAAARAAIERTNALALFPRLGSAPTPIPQSPVQRLRHSLSRGVMRAVARAVGGP